MPSPSVKIEINREEVRASSVQPRVKDEDAALRPLLLFKKALSAFNTSD